MVIESHDLMPDDLVSMPCEDGGSDLIVVTCIHWEAKEVTVTGYSLWFAEDKRSFTLPFNYDMEVWNA